MPPPSPRFWILIDTLLASSPNTIDIIFCIMQLLLSNFSPQIAPESHKNAKKVWGGHVPTHPLQTCQPPRIGRGNPRIPCIPRIHSRMQNLPRLLSCCSQDFSARRGGFFPCKFKPKCMQKFGHDEIIPSNICDRAFS